MISKKFAAALMALILLLTICAPVMAATGEIYTSKTTNILKTAAASGVVVGTVPANTKVEKIGTSGDYTLIRYNGITGYVLWQDLMTYIDGNDYKSSTASGTVVSGSSSSSSSPYNSGDVTVSALRQYSTTSVVNVRSGPGTSYKIIGKLKKGDLIDGASSPIGNWTNIIYNGKSGYVHSAYLAATGITYGSASSSETKKSSNIAYTRRKTEVTSRAGGGITVGTLLMAARCVKGGVKNEYTQITCNGKTGYVPTSDLISVTGTGAYEMTTLNAWRYAAKASAPAQLVPVEDENYRVGRFSKDEAVWALSGNKYWTEVYVNGRVAYVQTSDLVTKPIAYKEKTSTGPYKIGKVLKVTSPAGSATYETFGFRDAYIPVYEDDPYGYISKGTEVVVMLCSDKYAQVLWSDDRDYEVGTGVNFATNLHSAYVRLSDLG